MSCGTPIWNTPGRWTGGAPLWVFLVGVSVSVGGLVRRLVHDRGLGGVYYSLPTHGPPLVVSGCCYFFSR
jgi:hypothetical protein